MSQRTVSVEAARELARGRKPKLEPLSASYRVTTEVVRVRLPWPPSVNHYWRTAVIGKRAQTYVSAAGKQYRQDVIAAWRRLAVTFDGRLAVRIEAVFPDAIRRDLDNLCKAVLDSLCHAGAYRDDSQIKLLIVEQERIERPGWIDVTLGVKPGCVERTLFATEW